MNKTLIDKNKVKLYIRDMKDNGKIRRRDFDENIKKANCNIDMLFFDSIGHTHLFDEYLRHSDK